METDNDRVALEDVLIGEVWIASGQSNMQWPMAQTQDAEATIDAAQHSQIRLLTVPYNRLFAEDDHRCVLTDLHSGTGPPLFGRGVLTLGAACTENRTCPSDSSAATGMAHGSNRGPTQRTSTG